MKIVDQSSIEKIEKISFADRFDIQNTFDMIKKGAMINPDAPAISFILSGDQYAAPIQIKYQSFLEKIIQTANLFHELGVGPGDVVSILLPNLLHSHYILWGAEAAGIANPINPMLEPSAIADICQSANTKLLVALGEFPGSDIWEKALEVRRQLPGLKAVVRVLGPSDEDRGIYGFDEVIENFNGERLDSNRTIRPDDIASIYHTGGTTGLPKLVPHTHMNEVALSLTADMPMDLNPGDTLLVGLPLFHINGTLLTGSYPFSIGAHIVLLSPQGYRDPSIIKNFYRIVEYYQPAGFSAVPTILSMLLDTPKGNADISSLRFVICGAAPLSVDLFERFEQYTGIKILEIYGMTEGNATSNPYHGRRKTGSIGLRLPYGEIKIFIVDENGGFVREAETDEIGSLCMKGPCVFNGYLDDVHNNGIWPKAGWFNTGDLGRQDADGYLWLTGRKKELIIRGGHNIDPQIIEDVLYRLPQIQTAAAVGRPDPHAGEVPVAYVQFQKGAELTEDHMLNHLKRELGERAAIPKAIYVLDEIPLTPIGKIFKPVLCRDAVRRAYSEALTAIEDNVESFEVRVNPDKVYGSLAEIIVTPIPGMEPESIRARIKELLACYTIRYKLDIISR